MAADMCVPCGDGLINLRVGAIIIKDGKLLMVGNEKRPEYLYSVGGRIKFGETAREAVVREVFEETGVQMEIDRLGFVHENYFYGDAASNLGRLIYEISFYFFMKAPEDFEPVSNSFTEDGQEEFLRWITPGDPVRYYPEFFRTELFKPQNGVRHFITDERKTDLRGQINMKLSVIFEEKPNRWGFRGDPYFWDHLKERAGNMGIITPDELETWIKEEYLAVSGKPMTDKYGDFAIVEQFAHGGMSSGGVDNLWWVETGIPLLKSRLAAL